MLPLLQTHRQTVPTTNLDHIPNPINGQPIHDTQLQGAIPYQNRSFPIRTLHPHAHISGNSPYAVHASHRAREHQLRRKTPNGTIDAGYDGSSTKSSTGEPPLKQLALPGQSISSLEYQMLGGQSYHQNLVIDGTNVGAQLPGGLWQPPGYVVGPAQAHSFRPSQHAVVPFASVYQPVIRANEYNVRAFCPPPPTLVGGLPLGQLGWQQGTSPWDYQSGHDASAVPRGAYPLAPHPEYTPNLIAAPPLPASTNAFGYMSQDSNLKPQNAYTLSHDNYNDHPDFKEKALSQAYRCYASLVGYIQANARACMTKEPGGGTDHASPKHLIFPKPPRPRRENLGLSPSSRQYIAPTSNSSGIIFPSASFSSVGAQGHYTHAQQPSSHVMFAGVDQFRAQQRVASGPVPRLDSFNIASQSASPVIDARSSLDILKHLCEQSQWTWMEGVLILGCLHYAVEQYADALQCFSRISALDPRYFFPYSS